MSYHAFDQCFRPFFRYNTAKTRKYVEQQNISKIPVTEKSIEKLILVHFLLLFLFRQMVKIMHPVRPPCLYSRLKLSIRTILYTLISNLRFSI